jgi:hypothetical protein
MKSHRRALLTILAAAFLLSAFVGPATANRERDTGEPRTARSGIVPPSRPGGGHLEMYTATVDASVVQELVIQGYDVAAVEETEEGARVDLVLTRREANDLRRAGFDVEVTRTEGGQTVSEFAAQQQEDGFDVYRSWDEQGGIEDEIRRLARRNRQIAELHDLGNSLQGRDILAIRLTQNVRDVPVGSRPAVLYQATTHAREWISTEVGRRLLHWFIDNRNDPQVASILASTELWFIPVLNPDGYEHTFDVERLWRKNLRDNDGDGQITNSDGVDLNRNYPEHWNYDQEGSSSQFSSETYRGTAPASEPETQADISLFNTADIKFSISYHSYGQLLLYTQGWQVQTPSADDPIYLALTGTDDDPAVEGFDPGVGADLYTTNGEFTDWAHAEAGALAWTPELSEGCDGCGFVFPDDEALIQEEFERLLDFSVNVGSSAGDPDDPVSHAGIDTQGFYLDLTTIDPFKNGNPASELAVDLSYGGGASQPVEVLAKKAIGTVTLHYSINGGPEQTAPTSEAPDGDVFGGNNAYDVYYHYLRGEIPGIAVGDSVEYWFSGGGEESEHTTFDVVEDANADVLILAAEDRTGASNLPAYRGNLARPRFLSYYRDALTANGITSDVYDVDARGRRAPDDLGVLSHYDAVIWYTGNDLVTREPGWSPGNVSRLANDMTLAARAYLNRGGKLLYTGQWAGFVENGFAGGQFYDPVANEQCVVGGQLVLDRCQFMSDKNDFLQYYLGAFIYNSDAGTNPDTGDPFPVSGVGDPYTGMNWTFNGGNSAKNQVHTASFITTSSLLPESTYPQFASDAPAKWDRPGGNAFEPFDGDFYVYSQQADISYKRLQRTINVPAAGGEMTFRMSYDTEVDWDFAFVEAHTPGQDDWVTLPDLNGHTSTSTGESCPAGWFELHPFLERYQGADCSGAGWNAASGRSDGWEEWRVDLGPWAGGQVELSISYVSDWAIQGLGTFVDQIQTPAGDGSTSFETGLDGWTTPGPQPGSDPNPNDWIRTASVGFEEGAVVSTDDTLYFGFGFEGITGASGRNAVMDKSMGYLLGP